MNEDPRFTDSREAQVQQQGPHTYEVVKIEKAMTQFSGPLPMDIQGPIITDSGKRTGNVQQPPPPPPPK